MARSAKKISEPHNECRAPKALRREELCGVVEEMLVLWFAWFTSGARVYNLAVYCPKVSATMTEPMFSDLKVPPMNAITQSKAIAIFAVFAFAYFLSALIRAITGTLAPTLVQEFALTAGDLGLLVGIPEDRDRSFR
jgi:hypothetical protein